ncbi:Methyltransf-25 domain-containing protein [Mycena indigotica]|uniref:Methyltransf-25 domain-containing protein n=1 Tax=Mycena indigotica TaxID=2126181 RepID=A0A8H6T0C0_9AGAR|nr:Methyltransf-25 domain-containing protein [Mycena indigotica]KAF7307602.1 Methyltransf-25 domain-containing protein [Mycena indigotica]
MTSYTHGHQASVLRAHSWRTAQNSCAYLLSYVKPDMSILDVGCGPGTITVDLACLVPQGHVTGIEPSAEQEEVLDKARHLASSQGVTNLTFSRGDGHNLPFPDNMFDVVHAHQVLQHVADPVKVLSEMKRVVKSAGGIIAVRDIDYASMVWHPPSKGLSDWHEMYERTARANGGEPNAGRVLLSWALKAGIPRDCIEPMVGTWCFSKSEEKEWWSGTWAERVVQSALAKSAVEHGISTEAELQEMATAWKSWCVAPDAWFAMLHGELICRL